jgi:hypothetical protein
VPISVVATAGCRDQVTLAQSGLPDDMRWNPRISRIGEIAVPCTTNEPAVSRRIEPSGRFGIWYDWCRRRLWLIGPGATPSSAMPAMPATIPLILVIAASFVAMEGTTAVVLLVALVVVLRWCLRRRTRFSFRWGRSRGCRRC